MIISGGPQKTNWELESRVMIGKTFRSVYKARLGS
jgi:hypothetical protein